MRYYRLCRVVIPHFWAGPLRVTQPFATSVSPCGETLVRLACFMHAASVCPEPESNSPTKKSDQPFGRSAYLRVRSKNQRDRASVPTTLQLLKIVPRPPKRKWPTGGIRGRES